MRMWTRGKHRSGVFLGILDLAPRPEAPRRGLEGRSSMRRFGGALSSILRDAKLRLAPQDEVRDAKFCFAPREEVRDARLRLTPLKEDGDFGARQRRRGHALISPLFLAVLIALLSDSAATADSAPMVSPDRI